jgi:hypothetical protein
MDNNFLNKLVLKRFTRFFPKTLNRKIFRKYKIFFVPTNLLRLPRSFYPVDANIYDQINYINQFNKDKKIINTSTKKDLDKFLLNIFKKKKR